MSRQTEYNEESLATADNPGSQTQYNEKDLEPADDLELELKNDREPLATTDDSGSPTQYNEKDREPAGDPELELKNAGEPLSTADDSGSPTEYNKEDLEPADDPQLEFKNDGESLATADDSSFAPPIYGETLLKNATADEKDLELNRSESARTERPSGMRTDESNEAKPFIDTLENYHVTQANAINRILAHNCGFEIELQEGGFEISFLFRQQACRADMLFTLCVGGTDFVLGFERCIFANLEEVENLGDLPVEIRNVYFEVLLEDICERIETWTGLPVQIKNFGPAAQAIAPDSQLRLDFQMLRLIDGRRSEGFVITSGEGLQMVSDLMAALPSTPAHEYDNLTLLARVEIGKAHLNLEVMKQIEPQDIILIDNRDCESDEWPCRVYPAPRHYLAASWNHKKNHIIFVSDIQEGFMSNYDENPEILNDGAQRPERIEALDDLPIELNFDIGSIPISLRELKCVREGFIFEIQNSEFNPVRIRVNGKLIGSGQLVRLNGRMGVRILDMARP